MSKLAELRSHGYDASLLENGELDIDLPEGVELTSKLKTRLAEIKPLLVTELRAEQDLQSGSYRFSDYHTRKDMRGKGRLVIDFVSNDTGEVIQAYFNVNITYQRGQKKGDYFKTGYQGRFWILPRSKFAKFWIKTFGLPKRWSTVYRQMNQLKQFEYRGIEKQSQSYKQLTELTVVRKWR